MSDCVIIFIPWARNGSSASDQVNEMWVITDAAGERTTVGEMAQVYPELVAYDESGWEVNQNDLVDAPERLADAGYCGREYRRILFWESDASSYNDDGMDAVASAVWRD